MARIIWQILVLAGLLGSVGAAPRPIPDETIAYVASGELRLTTPDGAASRALASGYEYDDPAWNSTRTEITVERGTHDGPHELVILNRHGNVVRRLRDSSEAFRPAWDRAGRIYAITYGKPPHVLRWSGNQRQVLRIVGVVSQPQYLSFSPIGRLAILDDFAGVVVAHVAGDSIVVDQRLDLRASYIAQTAWLDDTRLVFVRRKAAGQPSDLAVVNTQTGEISAIATTGIYLRDFVSLSPDRKHAVVCAAPSSGETRWSLWVVSLAGTSSPKRITSGLEDVAPSWRGAPN